METSKVVETEKSNDIRYSVKAAGEWTPDMENLIDTTDGDRECAGLVGTPITSIAIDNVDKYRVFTRKRKWSKFKTTYDKTAPIGDDTPILNIEIHSEGIMYAVHCIGGQWLKPVTSGQPAGCGVPIDQIWIDRI